MRRIGTSSLKWGSSKPSNWQPLNLQLFSCIYIQITLIQFRFWYLHYFLVIEQNPPILLVNIGDVMAAVDACALMAYNTDKMVGSNCGTAALSIGRQGRRVLIHRFSFVVLTRKEPVNSSLCIQILRDVSQRRSSIDLNLFTFFFRACFACAWLKPMSIRAEIFSAGISEFCLPVATTGSSKPASSMCAKSHSAATSAPAWFVFSNARLHRFSPKPILANASTSLWLKVISTGAVSASLRIFSSGCGPKLSDEYGLRSRFITGCTDAPWQSG